MLLDICSVSCKLNAKNNNKTEQVSANPCNILLKYSIMVVPYYRG